MKWLTAREIAGLSAFIFIEIHLTDKTVSPTEINEKLYCELNRIPEFKDENRCLVL